MPFPIRCFTCQKPIAHKWESYKKSIDEGYEANCILDELKMRRSCCRIIFLTHVDIDETLLRYESIRGIKNERPEFGLR